MTATVNGMRVALGIAILITIFGGAFLAMARESGVREAAVVFGFAIGITALIVVACYLITGGS